MTVAADTPPISPFLWFNDNAEEAVDFYLSVFPHSRKIDVLRSSVQTSVAEGKVLTLSFELNGQRFTALNGGPAFHFTEAISFFVRCDTRRRSTPTGRSSRRGVRRVNADGSRTSTDSHGRSCRPTSWNSSEPPRGWPQ